MSGHHPAQKTRAQCLSWASLLLKPGKSWGACFSFRGLSALPAPTIPRSLGWCPPSTALAFVPPGPQPDSGSKVPAAGLSGRGWEGAPRSGPTPRSPPLRGTRGVDAGRARPRATQARASGRWGLGGGGTRPPPPEKPRECGYSSRFPAAPRESRPQSCPAVLARLRPDPQGVRRPVDPLARLLGPHAGPTARIPGQAAAACLPVPTAMPRPAQPGPARP